MDSLKILCKVCNKLFTLKDKRSIKKSHNGFICRNCSLARNRLQNRIKLLKDAPNILWNETKNKYGHTYINIKMRDQVICKCIKCGNPTEIQYRGPNDLLKKSTRARHKKCFEHSKKALQKSTSASRKYWSNPESHELASSIIAGLWRDKEFRNKVVSSLSGKERNNNESFKQRSKRSSELWNRIDFRRKLLSIMQSVEHKKLKSEIMTEEKREFNRQLMVKLWTNDNYREHMANTAFWNPQPSKLQRKLIPIFDSLNIEWQEEYLIRFWHFDYFLPDKNTLIEVQGNYWHTKPEVTLRDKRKRSFVDNHTNLKLIEVWEDEFKNEQTLIEKINKL